MKSYVALIHREPGSDYGVSFPDFPGCVSAGASLDEAVQMGQEALGLHIRGMVEDGEPVPAPASLEAVMADPQNRDAMAVLMVAPLMPAKVVRVNISLPEDVLGEIDRHAEQRGLTRSAFLARAARQVIERERS